MGEPASTSGIRSSSTGADRIAHTACILGKYTTVASLVSIIIHRRMNSTVSGYILRFTPGPGSGQAAESRGEQVFR